jgi:serine/tyrosine/threonine adenylyltransferase
MSANSTAVDQLGWNLDCSYARLPETFYARLRPIPVREPGLVIWNESLAQQLGLDRSACSEEALARLCAGNELPSAAEPLAQAYAGHQFGHFTMLGDGRAILLGEQQTSTGERFDIQYKGSGRTPYSRGGDGRAALGPMLREYLISEALAALKIPTTRSLAVATTGEPVYREQVLPGAVLTRVAASHIRVGTFQYLAARRDIAGLRQLADYTLNRHYPELASTTPTQATYLTLLEAIMERQASLMAQWLNCGFIHGVMNTDNMALSGETIDFGPCAFMDDYDPKTVFSSIDHHGRYAYANQPFIAQWNLTRLAETMLPLLHEEEQAAIALAEQALQSFMDRFEHHWLAGMRRKLGLQNTEAEDATLAGELLDWMQQQHADFTNTFRDLSSPAFPAGEMFQQPAFQAWYARWQQRLQQEAGSPATAYALMQSSNPAVIPRNHHVEAALTAASQQLDFSPLHNLLQVLQNPYGDLPTDSPYRSPPAPQERVYQTFCGT